MAQCLCLRSLLTPCGTRSLGMHLRIQSCLDGTKIYKWQHRQVGTCPTLCTDSKSPAASKVTVHFINQDGVRNSVTATEGESLLDVVVNKNLDISGFGACEGTLACSTCHLIFEEDIHERLDPVMDEEVDMLDLAYGLTKTSRLGCQIVVQPWMEGMTVHVPKGIKDQRELAGSKKTQ
ncbi:ferredoxin 1b [Denticeps clupeoides]|uniref:2Fe-2S ferredoxin-type domain-containing protein n=1 Tax=Denticeps clupeoides TaxID=299321 RepID=A0AAY4BBY9_9TELE|nr:adrenodoxin-like [Denticeps clupeoides]